MKKTNRNPKKINRSQEAFRFPGHAWSTQHEHANVPLISHPITGYDYQSFEDIHFFSMLRPEDIDRIVDALTKGCAPLIPEAVLHFTDCYAPLVGAFLIEGDLLCTGTNGFHIAAAACMHVHMDNPQTAYEICRFLVEQGMDWPGFVAVSRLSTDDEVNDMLCSDIVPIWQEANATYMAARLGDQLTAKKTSRSAKKI